MLFITGFDVVVTADRICAASMLLLDLPRIKACICGLPAPWYSWVFFYACRLETQRARNTYSPHLRYCATRGVGEFPHTPCEPARTPFATCNKVCTIDIVSCAGKCSFDRSVFINALLTQSGYGEVHSYGEIVIKMSGSTIFLAMSIRPLCALFQYSVAKVGFLKLRPLGVCYRIYFSTTRPSSRAKTQTQSVAMRNRENNLV